PISRTASCGWSAKLSSADVLGAPVVVQRPLARQKPGGLAVTLAVFRKELAVLWASPVPYMTGALFHVVLGLLYVDQLAGRGQAVIQPLFPIAGFLLLLVVPLLAMRTMAEEIRSGTLDVLQVGRLPSGPLLVGKWLAVWVTTVV